MKYTLMSTSLSFLSRRSFILISFMISGCLQSISYKIAITFMNYCSEHENLQRIKSPILSVSRSTEERRYFSASLAAFLEAYLGTLRSAPMSLFTYLNMYWLAISLILAA